MRSIFSAMCLMGASTMVAAHTGHDHSSAAAGLSHVVFYGGLLVSAIACAAVAKGYSKKQSDNK